MAVTTREFLKEATWTRQMVDRWLDSSARSWSEYEPELGYRLRDSVVRDGVDSSFTISQYAPTGERRMVNFADRPCRINSYGDGFTQCAQVRDGETWQEYLAAHFGEPIRNYGVGGFGVYQAYRRMLREEATPLAAGNVIFNVWSDDHFRSIYPLRWLHSDIDSFRKQKDIPSYAVWPFGTPPWAHLRLDTATGEFQEHETPYSTPQSLYQLTDVDHVYETYKDDFDLQAYLAQQRVTDVNVAVLQRMADALEMSADFSSPDAIAATGHDLLQRCALRSSMYVLDKARQFIRGGAQEVPRTSQLLVSTCATASPDSTGSSSITLRMAALSSSMVFWRTRRTLGRFAGLRKSMWLGITSATTAPEATTSLLSLRKTPS